MSDQQKQIEDLKAEINLYQRTQVELLRKADEHFRQRNEDNLTFREIAKRHKELTEVIRDTLPFLTGLEDEGPEGEGWQSNELLAVIARAEKAIGKNVEKT